MFSGIVSEVGAIIQVSPSFSGSEVGGLRLKIKWGKLNIFKVSVGESISVSGVCLTVTSKSLFCFFVDVSRETLSATTGLDQLGPVNIEKSLKFGEKVCGHLVSGHVDGIAEIKSVIDLGESKKVLLGLPREFGKFVSRKGSIALDGVSLTINEVNDLEGESEISVNLIPHTIINTNFLRKKSGMFVNFEVDMMARSLNRLLADKK